MNVSPELDARFRTAALAEGIVDVRYDVVASPVGDLLIAATDRCPRCLFAMGVDAVRLRLGASFRPAAVAVFLA